MSLKRVNKTVRLLPHEWADAKRLARLLQRERREKVYPSELIRDIGVEGIRAKLIEPPASQAA